MTIRPPRFWSEVLRLLPSAVASSPKAWAIVDAELGASALALLTGATLSELRQQIATKLVSPLITAAAAFERVLPTLGSAESAAHAQWRADLAAVNALVADVDGGSSSGATARELVDRIATAKSNTGALAPGKVALLNALRVPAETAVDQAFNDALAAVKFFFT